jgi:hypothetical protein
MYASSPVCLTGLEALLIEVVRSNPPNHVKASYCPPDFASSLLTAKLLLMHGLIPLPTLLMLRCRSMNPMAPYKPAHLCPPSTASEQPEHLPRPQVGMFSILYLLLLHNCYHKLL